MKWNPIFVWSITTIDIDTYRDVGKARCLIVLGCR